MGETTAARHWWAPLWLGLGVFGGLTAISAFVGPSLDTAHYLYWTYQAVEKGYTWLYAGTYPIDFAVYPPLVFLFWAPTGWLYRTLVDPAMGFDGFTASRELTFWLKLTPLAFQGLLAAAVAVAARRRGASRRAATLAGLAIGLTPGAVLDLVVWGQPDTLHSFFLVVAVAGLIERRPLLGGASYALAALSKPQAWALGPVIVVIAWRRLAPRAAAIGAAACAAVVAAILAPFVLDGRWRDLLRLPGEINAAMDAASANAHNVWWIVTGAATPFIPDTARLVGDLTIREASVVAVIAVGAVAMWRAWLDDEPFAVSAWLSYGFFMTVTRAHENHSFAALALLAPMLPFSAAARVLFTTLSLTLFANIGLHDPDTGQWVRHLVGAETHRWLSLVMAWFNLAVFAGWTIWLVRGSFGASRAAIPVRGTLTNAQG